MKHYLRVVSSLSRWQNSKMLKSYPTSSHREKLHADCMKGKGSPSFWLVESESDIERVVLGTVLRRREPLSVNNVRVIAFEEKCFLLADDSLNLHPKLDENFPLNSIAAQHYVLENSNEDVIDGILAKFLECCGFMKEYRRIPSKDSSPKSFKEMVTSYAEQIDSVYQDIARSLEQADQKSE